MLHGKIRDRCHSKVCMNMKILVERVWVFANCDRVIQQFLVFQASNRQVFTCIYLLIVWGQFTSFPIKFISSRNESFRMHHFGIELVTEFARFHSSFKLNHLTKEKENGKNTLNMHTHTHTKTANRFLFLFCFRSCFPIRFDL